MKALEDLNYTRIMHKTLGSKEITLGLNQKEKIYRLKVVDNKNNTNQDIYSKPNKQEKNFSTIIGGITGLFTGYLLSTISHKINQDISPLVLAIPPTLLGLAGIPWGRTKGVKLMKKNEIIKELKKYRIPVPHGF